VRKEEQAEAEEALEGLKRVRGWRLGSGGEKIPQQRGIAREVHVERIDFIVLLIFIS
jgi:hypothetical protein